VRSQTNKLTTGAAGSATVTVTSGNPMLLRLSPPMKSFAVVFLALLSSTLTAQTNSLLIEDMTWTEVRDAIAAGKTTAIYYAASTEQNGPGVALGKHVLIAHYLGSKIAAQLGNALVYPTMPFAPTGDFHAGTDDTAELMYVDKMINGDSSKWIRPARLIRGREGDGTGVDGDETKATLELGKMFTDAKVSFAVNQIKQLIAAAK
jgi:creatinine amidohydrolase/Fe(II)-dependent formamide hydrolase-like protein